MGGKRLTTFPVGPRSAAEIVWRLKQAAGNADAYISSLVINSEALLGIDAVTDSAVVTQISDVLHASRSSCGARSLSEDFA